MNRSCSASAFADVDIVMGAAGTDIAVETGDVVLTSDALSKIGWLVLLPGLLLNEVSALIAIANALKAAKMVVVSINALTPRVKLTWH